MPLTTHICPGCARRAVPQHQLSCRSCWYRLPHAIRHRLNNAFHQNPLDHPEAMRACLDWYADNPPGAPAHESSGLGTSPEENFYEGSGK